MAHEGTARRLVLGLKYRNARTVADALAIRLVETLADRCAVDVVTWAPTSARRVAQRGYDPAELLARAVARRLGKPCRRLLRRGRRSSPQTGKDRASRLAGPVFHAKPLWRPRRILLVDDVTTTGATLRRASDALVAAGASAVTCIAATRAP
jgi:predicted amidophosphoribosyltransferase